VIHRNGGPARRPGRDRGLARPARPTCGCRLLVTDCGDSSDPRPSGSERAVRRPAYHARNPYSSAPSVPPAAGRSLDVTRCVCGAGSACVIGAPPADRGVGRVCDSPATLRVAAAPKSGGTQSAAERGPDPGCGAGAPTGPAPDSGDTTRRD
jgi:hypothetical protein